MRNEHEHMREGMHTHGLNGHINQWFHDTHFWATIALIVALGLIIAALIFFGYATGNNWMFSRYNYPM